mmetsp:Transcript_7641/g.26315  ORF Transcript_7641/g.26315 Transcript_7641/m.26315 type:complete len:223 (-) Transcript_7641:1619-2287(-)
MSACSWEQPVSFSRGIFRISLVYNFAASSTILLIHSAAKELCSEPSPLCSSSLWSLEPTSSRSSRTSNCWGTTKRYSPRLVTCLEGNTLKDGRSKVVSLPSALHHSLLSLRPSRLSLTLIIMKSNTRPSAASAKSFTDLCELGKSGDPAKPASLPTCSSLWPGKSVNQTPMSDCSSHDFEPSEATEAPRASSRPPIDAENRAATWSTLRMATKMSSGSPSCL